MKRFFYFVLILFCFQLFSCNQKNLWFNEFLKKADEVSSVAAQNNSHVEVLFNKAVDKTTASNPANYSINGLNVLNAAPDTTDSKKVVVNTSSQANVEYTLIVTNVKRQDGVTINTDGDNDTFEGDALPFVSAINLDSMNTITVVFSEDVEESGAEDFQNYGITDSDNTELNVISATVESGNTVQLLTDNQEEKAYLLTVNDVYDMTGNRIDSSNNTKSFSRITNPQLMNVVWHPDRLLDVVFFYSVEEISAQTIENYDISGGLTIVGAVRDDADNSIVHIETGAQSDATYTLTASGVTDLNLNEIDIAHASFDFTGNASPQLNGVSWHPNRVVDVVFSEPIDQTIAENTANYVMTPSLCLVNATRDTGNPAIVHLVTGDQNDSSYLINVNGIKDLSGNTITPDPSAGTFAGNAVPFIVDVQWRPNRTVDVIFSEPVTESLAEDYNSNYTIDNGLSILGAELDGNTVHLSTSYQNDMLYNLTVQNIADPAGNSMNPNPYSKSFMGNASPMVYTVVGLPNRRIEVTFSEDVNDTALNINNYSVIEDADLDELIVQSATRISGKTIILNTIFPEDGDYTLTASNIEDVSLNTVHPDYDSAIFAEDANPYVINVENDGKSIIRVFFSEVMWDGASNPSVTNRADNELLYTLQDTSYNIKIINAVNFETGMYDIIRIDLPMNSLITSPPTNYILTITYDAQDPFTNSLRTENMPFVFTAN